MLLWSLPHLGRLRHRALAVTTHASCSASLQALQIEANGLSTWNIKGESGLTLRCWPVEAHSKLSALHWAQHVRTQNRLKSGSQKAITCTVRHPVGACRKHKEPGAMVKQRRHWRQQITQHSTLLKMNSHLLLPARQASRTRCSTADATSRTWRSCYHRPPRLQTYVTQEEEGMC